MADEEESTKARFGWNHPGEVKFEDEDGNLIPGGPVPEEAKAILAKHNKELEATQDSAKRIKRSQPKIKLHIHPPRR